MIIVIISFLLDNVISNLLNYNSIFNPLFTLTSLILIYPNFNKKSNNYFIYAFILGLIYDISITNTLFLNAFVFFSLSLLIRFVLKKIKYNYLSILVLLLGSIIYYRLITYIILVIINYLNFSFYYLFKSIYSSIFLNIIYISFVYLIINIKRLILKKN